MLELFKKVRSLSGGCMRPVAHIRGYIRVLCDMFKEVNCRFALYGVFNGFRI